MEERTLPRTLHGKLTILDTVRDAMTSNYYLFVLAWSSMYKTLIEEKGEEGRELARKAAEDAGVKWGEAMIEVAGMTAEDTSIPAIAKAYHESMQFYGYDNEIIEVSEKRAVVRVTKCPLLEHWRRQYPDVIPHVCYVEPYIDVGSYKFLNPNVHLEIPCKLSEGSPYSDYVLTLVEDGETPPPELFDTGKAVFDEYLAKREAKATQ